MSINAFCGIFNVLALLFVVAISLIAIRKYPSGFFTPWINGHFAMATFMVLQQFPGFERFPLYVLLEAAIALAVSWYFLQTADLLSGSDHRLLEGISLGTIFLVTAVLCLLGLPFNTMAILPSIALCLSFIRCGLLFLKPSDFLGGMGFALWIGWPLILVGCTPLFYPLVHGSNDWIGTLIATFLHLLGGVGMIVYLMELNNHKTLQAKERYQSLFEQAHDGIFLADPQGTILEVNSSGCTLLGYPRETLLQRTFMEFVKTGDPLGDLFASQAPFVETELKRQDGTLVPAELSFKMLTEGLGQLLVRDVSERQRVARLQQEQIALLEQADRMKDEFLTIVSHELERPLIELRELSSALLASNEAHPLAERIQEKSDRMLGIIEGLQQTAKEEGGFKMYPPPSREAILNWAPSQTEP